VDGSPLGGYDPWASSEPNGGDSENCALLNVNGRLSEWGDEDCENHYRFICE
jgi:hypothetical protein